MADFRCKRQNSNSCVNADIAGNSPEALGNTHSRFTKAQANTRGRLVKKYLRTEKAVRIAVCMDKLRGYGKR